MLKRILTGIVAFCFILVPVLFFADTVALPLGVAVFALIAAYEILHCVGLHKNLWLSLPLYLASGAFPFVLRYADGIGLTLMPLFLCVPLLTTLAVAVFSHGKVDIRDASAAYLLWFYSFVGFAAVLYIHDMIAGGKYFYLLAFIGAWVTDTFAYFTGMLLGRHKLIPDVSPKKTVEGAVGGVVFCTLGFVVFGILYNKFWIADGAAILPLWLMAVIGVLVSIVSQIGDLSLSLLKRKYGIKDFGKVFPGHGGVMDRFDSVLAVAIMLLVCFTTMSVFGL
ncbi:MAG: phosphatidate cytidylyltransferase [Clostridia bacterium]|nr:phosphatidate cytidylyltransferase [Clostridia bacterium]